MSLDLTDPANLAARARTSSRCSACGRRPPTGPGACARSPHGSTPTARSTCACSASASTQSALGADVGAGAGFGAGYDRTEEARDLLAAWSLRAGGRLQEREDCVPA